MQDLMTWSQTDEACVPSTSQVCNVDPVRIQFAVEFMRAMMPLVLMGQIKLGLLKKFLTAFKRISRIYPRIGFQMMGLMKANPPLMIHAIMHIFSNDGPDLDGIRGTSVSWGESPDITFYQFPNCIGEQDKTVYTASLDQQLIDLCSVSFLNGQGVNLSAMSVKLAPYTFVKLISCPDNPLNKQQIMCSGNMQEDCEIICQGQSGSCMGTCLTVKQKKMLGYTLENCNNPVTVKCLRSYYSQTCVNLDSYFAISYVWGRTMAGADDMPVAADKECPAT